MRLGLGRPSTIGCSSGKASDSRMTDWMIAHCSSWVRAWASLDGALHQVAEAGGDGGGVAPELALAEAFGLGEQAVHLLDQVADGAQAGALVAVGGGVEGAEGLGAVGEVARRGRRGPPRRSAPRG